MLKQHAKIVARIVYLADISVTIISFFAAYWLRDVYMSGRELGRLLPLKLYYPLLFVIVIVWSLALFFFKAYRSFRVVPFLDELKIIVKAVLCGSIAVLAVEFATKSYQISRLFLFIFMLLNIVLLAGERVLIRLARQQIRKRGYNFRNVVIVGTDDAAVFIAKQLEQYRHLGLRVSGFIADGKKEQDRPATINQCPVLGSIDDMEEILKREVVDEVIFSSVGRATDRFEDVFLMLEEHGINARMVANMFPHMIAKVSVEQIENIPLLTFSTVPSNAYKLMVKRISDVTASLSLLVLLSPLLLLTAALIKATSPGPVLFKQRRSGLNGRTFALYKFRSMFADADARKKELEKLNEMTGPVFKIKNDPRITPVGRFMRKSSIDELPQLWNVLRGDMSLVGPRPPLPAEVAQYERWQRRRLSMRPGLTCIWQISGRNKITDFNEWVRLDLHYIDTWSLALDMKILLKTIPVVLLRKGAE